jgi:hypothetical protein
MEGESFLLACLVAPGSVEAELGKLQAGIFSAHGLLSAQALPPLLPVAFLSVDVRRRGLLRAVDLAARAPWRVRVTGTSWVDGFLFVSVESGGMWDALRRRTLAACGPEPRRLFPAFEGFFIGCGEATPAQREGIRPGVPPVLFTSAFLALVQIDAPRGRAEWWRELYWETLEQRPLRGRREE